MNKAAVKISITIGVIMLLAWWGIANYNEKKQRYEQRRQNLLRIREQEFLSLFDLNQAEILEASYRFSNNCNSITGYVFYAIPKRDTVALCHSIVNNALANGFESSVETALCDIDSMKTNPPYQPSFSLSLRLYLNKYLSVGIADADNPERGELYYIGQYEWAISDNRNLDNKLLLSIEYIKYLDSAAFLKDVNMIERSGGEEEYCHHDYFWEKYPDNFRN